MNALIVTLVITMMVDGQDFRRNERMESIAACWERAQRTMDDIRSSEHRGITIRNIGVGCVVDAGDPA